MSRKTNRGGEKTNRVELLDIPKDPDVLDRHKVDGDSLSAESTGSSDSVEVVLSVDRQIVVDDQGDLLDVDSSSPDIGRDEHSAESSE